MRDKSLRELKGICLEEIIRNKSLVFSECTSYKEAVLFKGERLELRPIIYFDAPISSVTFLSALCAYINKVIDVDKIDAVSGIATQGIPIAFYYSGLMQKPAFFVRKESKDYGTYSPSSALPEGRDVLLIDNFIYSGGTLENASKTLEELGMNPVYKFCIINFENQFRKSDTEKISSLFTMDELIDSLIEKNYFPENISGYIKLFVKDQTNFHTESNIFKEYRNEYAKLKK